VADSSKHDNEPSGYMNVGSFLASLAHINFRRGCLLLGMG
jgi:hypothetical protein